MACLQCISASQIHEAFKKKQILYNQACKLTVIKESLHKTYAALLSSAAFLYWEYRFSNWLHKLHAEK